MPNTTSSRTEFSHQRVCLVSRSFTPEDAESLRKISLAFLFILMPPNYNVMTLIKNSRKSYNLQYFLNQAIRNATLFKNIRLPPKCLPSGDGSFCLSYPGLTQCGVQVFFDLMREIRSRKSDDSRATNGDVKKKKGKRMKCNILQSNDFRTSPTCFRCGVYWTFSYATMYLFETDVRGI